MYMLYRLIRWSKRKKIKRIYHSYFAKFFLKNLGYNLLNLEIKFKINEILLKIYSVKIGRFFPAIQIRALEKKNALTAISIQLF